MGLAQDIKTCAVAAGELAIFWFGQAGFLLKDHEGRELVVDPYLTDCGDRIRGFKRLSPMLIAPEECAPQYYVITHTHFDHFDFDAIPVIAKQSGTHFFGPQSCMEELEKLEIGAERRTQLAPDVSVSPAPGIVITGCPADHGTMAPDAIGVLVEMGGHVVYFSGDTALHPTWCERIAEHRPEVAALSINGAFGNMNAREGAQAAALLGVSIAVPCHFWTFPEHGGEPLLFRELVNDSGSCRALCMRQGEMLLLPKK